MAKAEHESSSSQFTIKRLFWTMVVASLVFKLAESVGFFRMITNAWGQSQGSQTFKITVFLIIIAAVILPYIFWIGIRLPWLIERYWSIRKKRLQRRQQLRDEYEALRKEK